ncbi:hypothetical protein GCM10009868_32150 [Terrabacter aerolatus]|uniref:Uncharacterized protein n=1 Tax=Terrabacter aerolatus TaxID=422442 RepID=A0A512CYP2_9MICO|nr:hypothetical protein TAE01_11510 [Terrabacter aerolatus]
MGLELSGDQLLAHDVAQVAETLEPGLLAGDERVVSHGANLPTGCDSPDAGGGRPPLVGGPERTVPGVVAASARG